MTVTASVSIRWIFRMSLVLVIIAGFGLWSLYDGTVGYPKINAAIEAFNNLQQQDRLDEYEQLARTEGWPSNPGSLEEKSSWDIRTQYIMALVCLLFASLCCLRIAVNIPRRMSANDSFFVAADGRRIAYGDIIKIDKRKWERKAIAVITGKDQNGSMVSIKVDDWIFVGAADVLREIEINAVNASITGDDGLNSSDNDDVGNGRASS